MKLKVLFAGLSVALLGACSADLSLNNVTFKPETMLGGQPAWMTGNQSGLSADLLSADGQCRAASEQGQATAGGIALHMSECEVVRRAGPVEKFEFGSSGADRLLVLTYLHGPAPGIYRFTAGRLTSIERAPVAEPSATASKPRVSGKKPAGS